MILKDAQAVPEASVEILKEIASEVFQWEYRLLHGQGKLCPKCKGSTGVTVLYVKNFHALRDVKTPALPLRRSLDSALGSLPSVALSSGRAVDILAWKS